MSDINTAKKETLAGYGYTGALQDAYWKYLLSETGETSGAIQDLERKILEGFGYEGPVQEMWFEYLRASGYTNSLQEMLHDFWNDGQGFTPFWAPLTHSLVLARGTGNPTYTRATTATFTDWEGVQRTAPAGCARFEGGRMVYNLWTTSSATLSNSANKSLTLAAGDYTFSMGAGTGTATFSGTGGATGTLAASASGRVEVTKTISAGTFVVTASVADLVDLQVELVSGQADQSASEYVSVGVLSAPYHGAGVDGVQFFNTNRSGALLSPQPAYLAEGARTNLCTYSQDMSNAAWSKMTSGSGSAPVCTQNYSVAPAGTMTATRVVLTRGADSSSANYSVLRSAVIGSLANPHTSSLSVWMKTNDASTKIIGFGSSYLAGYNMTVTGDWQRFVIDGLVVSQPIESMDIFLRGTLGTSADADLSIWGAQIELGSFASTYIPTTTVAVTRNADIDQYPTASNVVAAAGSVYLEYTPYHAPSGTVFLWGTYVDASNYTGILHDGVNLIFRKRIAATNYDAPVAHPLLPDETYKIMATWGSAGMTLQIDDLTSLGNSNTTNAQIGTSMQFGADGNSLQQPFGKLGECRVW